MNLGDNQKLSLQESTLKNGKKEKKHTILSTMKKTTEGILYIQQKLQVLKMLFLEEGWQNTNIMTCIK